MSVIDNIAETVGIFFRNDEPATFPPQETAATQAADTYTGEWRLPALLSSVQIGLGIFSILACSPEKEDAPVDLEIKGFRKFRNGFASDLNGDTLQNYTDIDSYFDI